MQGVALPSSINPNPFFIRRGFDLNPKPLCPLQGRGLTDSEGDPLHQGSCVPSVASGKAERWYGSRAFAPTGFAIISYIPAVAAPWKGAHIEAVNIYSVR